MKSLGDKLGKLNIGGSDEKVIIETLKTIQSTVKESEMTERVRINNYGKIIPEIIKLFKSFSDLMKEKEITDQIKDKTRARIKEAETELEKALSKERVELVKIQKEYLIEKEKQKNEADRNKMQFIIINRILDSIHNLEKQMQMVEECYGIADHRAKYIFDSLHTLNIELTRQLPQLKG